MAIDDKIWDEKVKYDINREAAKVSGLSSGKVDKYKFLIDEDILPSDQSRIIEQARFAYSHLGKTVENNKYKQWNIKDKNKLKLWKL